MASIQNDRDLILQSTSPRVIPVLIPIDRVDGLPGRLDGIDGDIEALGTEVNGLLNNTKDLSIRVSSITVSDTTETTLTAIKKNGLTGTPVWSVFAGSATITGSGDSVTIAGSSVTSASITVRASINGKDAFATINKIGALATANTVNLTTQVTGQLANSNVSGLGALALLNTVNLSTQTTGALNGQTQVTNLGTLAYANSIAANQIGAGTLAAGVIYAGTINADKINAGSFTGKEFTGGIFTGGTFRTKADNIFPRVEISEALNSLSVFNSYGEKSIELNSVAAGGIKLKAYSLYDALVITPGSTNSSSSNGISVTVPSYGIQSDSPFCPLFLQPKSSFPSQQPSSGGIFMHTTHGLCVSDGTKWLKAALTPV